MSMIAFDPIDHSDSNPLADRPPTAPSLLEKAFEDRADDVPYLGRAFVRAAAQRSTRTLVPQQRYEGVVVN